MPKDEGATPPQGEVVAEFQRVLHAWKELAERRDLAAERYRLEKARALIGSTQSTEAKRGADADIVTTEARVIRDRLIVAAMAAEYEVQFLIAERKR